MRGELNMLKKTITYENFAGETVTEDFYFNLTKAELLQLEMSMPNGLAAHIDRLVANQEGEKLLDMFDRIITKAYGVKSFDGKQFVKSQEELNKFKFSGAYDALFVEIALDPKAADEFTRGILPKNLGEAPAPKVQDFKHHKKPINLDRGLTNASDNHT